MKRKIWIARNTAHPLGPFYSVREAEAAAGGLQEKTYLVYDDPSKAWPPEDAEERYFDYLRKHQ